jgi:hypothetical protein
LWIPEWPKQQAAMETTTLKAIFTYRFVDYNQDTVLLRTSDDPSENNKPLSQIKLIRCSAGDLLHFSKNVFLTTNI